MRVRICPTESLTPVVSYGIETLLETAGLFWEHGTPGPEPGQIAIHYGRPKSGEGNGCASIIISPSTREEVMDDIRHGDGHLPLWHWEGDSVVIHKDLALMTAILLMLEEERLAKRSDGHGRFSGVDSPRGPAGLRLPLVNAFCERLLDVVSRIASKTGAILLRRVPGIKGRPFALALSHDVDAFDIARPEVHCFEKIDRGEEERGVRSSFYFCMTSGRGYHPEEGYWDPPYTVKDPGFPETIARLGERGFEVGLHGSYDSGSFRDPKALTREKALLEHMAKAPVLGGRQHYLRFLAPDTWQTHETCGLLYDSTVGYHDRIGFRAGAAAPFRPFDPAAGAPFDLWELPLLIMDGALFDMETDLDTAEKKWEAAEEVLTRVAACHGCGAILWHQRVFSHPAHSGWGEIYWRILDWVNQRGGFLGPAKEIIETWRALSALRLITAEQGPGLRRWRFCSPRPLERLTLELRAPEGQLTRISSSLSPERLTCSDGAVFIHNLKEGEEFTLAAMVSEGQEKEAGSIP